MRKLILPTSLMTLVLLSVVAAPTLWAEKSALVGGAAGGSAASASVDPILTLKPVNPISTAAVREARIKDLLESIQAIEDKGLRMSDRYRRKIADAALYAEEKTGVDATFMVALARMESDFRGLVMINAPCKYALRSYGCYADCGMTQHHVRGSLIYVQKQCEKLAKNHRYSFLKSAQEIAGHIKYCNDPQNAKRHKPLRRCILNRYNMGTLYKRTERCNRANRCGYLRRDRFGSKEAYLWAYSDCKKRRRKCRIRAGYWKKLSCFEYGARHKIRSKRSCRWCYSIPKITTRFYDPPQVPATTPSFLSYLTRP
jgi:hypothetical protein